MSSSLSNTIQHIVPSIQQWAFSFARQTTAGSDYCCCHDSLGQLSRGLYIPLLSRGVLNCEFCVDW